MYLGEGTVVGTEETIARRFVHSANLRRILEQTGTPEVIQNCKPIFQKLHQENVKKLNRA